MGSTSKYGRATINPTAPSAVGTCDRCGFLYNLHVLRWQFQWAGTGMINKQLRVCPTCYDKPSEFLRTIILPADPPPVNQPRPEPYLVDEVNEYWLRAAGLGVPMFGAAGDVAAALDHNFGLVPSFAALSDLASTMLLGIGLTGALSDASDLAATALLGIGLTVAFSDASDLAAELTQVEPEVVARTFTDSFVFGVANTFTETGATIGSAAADRLVFVVISGIVTENQALTSVTIGGVSAAQAVQVRQAQNGDPDDYMFTAIWWALVPSGTTANIVLVYTGATIFGSCAVYAVTGADTTTPVVSSDTDGVTTGDVTLSLTIGNETAVIAGSCNGASSADAAITWTNATEDVEFAQNIGVFLNTGTASRADAVGPGGTTITSAVSSANSEAAKSMAGVVIQPA